MAETETKAKAKAELAGLCWLVSCGFKAVISGLAWSGAASRLSYSFKTLSYS